MQSAPIPHAVMTPRSDPIERVSIIAPAFNEADVLPAFVSEVEAVMAGLGLAYEVVFINDGSSDKTLDVMHALARANTSITIVNLTRRFGKEIAMTAGLAHATGTVIVIIDTDLQDPPRLIGDMIEGWREGYDVVFGQRIEREGEPWLKKATASWFYRLMAHTGPVVMPKDTGDFRLMSRRAAEALLQLPERHRFMKGLYAWVGYPQKALPYHRKARGAGVSKWSYWRLWNFAIEGITSYTIAPLKLASYLGIATACVATVAGLYIVVSALVFGDPVPGFPTVMAAILALGGVQLLVLGVIGEYLGRIFNETKRRPLYLVEDVAWAKDADPSRRLNLPRVMP